MTSPLAELSHLTRIPETATAATFGFRFGDKGTHTSRTLMLEELEQVFRGTPADADRAAYTAAIIDENLTDKRTAATRRITNQRLGELYSLDRSVLIFRILRQFWELDNNGRPLLALLCGLARDPLLRATSPPILSMQVGEELARQRMTDAVREAAGNRLNDNTIDKVVRNASSSWTQSGHLKGRARKTRQAVRPTPLSVAYALFIGYLFGLRGQRLFNTLWTEALDSSVDELVFLAMDAKRLGVLDLKQAGEVIEIGFAPILTPDEMRDTYGTN